jgi:hypothetical protein
MYRNIGFDSQQIIDKEIDGVKLDSENIAQSVTINMLSNFKTPSTMLCMSPEFIRETLASAYISNQYWKQSESITSSSDTLSSCSDENVVPLSSAPNFFIHHYLQDLNYMSCKSSEAGFFIRHKTRIFMKHVMNIFYTKEHVHDMWEVYIKTHRAYTGFATFAKLWRLKHAIVQVSDDLCMNPITIQPGRSISIFQNNSIYYFSISDLINICTAALIHSPGFFSDPHTPRNPYINLPFTNAMMYKIYDSVRKSNYRMPILLHLYYLCDFDINRFYLSHEATVRSEYINNFVKSGDTDELSIYVDEMLDKFSTRPQLHIDSEFPQEILLDIMRPFLRLYFIHRFSLSVTEDKYRSYYILKYKLKKFIEFNPAFGRKRMVRSYNGRPFSGRRHYVESFNTTHITFNDIVVNSDSGAFVVDDDENRDSDTIDDEDQIDDHNAGVTENVLLPDIFASDHSLEDDDDDDTNDTDSMS